MLGGALTILKAMVGLDLRYPAAHIKELMLLVRSATVESHDYISSDWLNHVTHMHMLRSRSLWLHHT